MEAGGLDGAKTKTDSAQRKAAAELKGGVFKKGAKAIGVKSIAERTGNLKIRSVRPKRNFKHLPVILSHRRHKPGTHQISDANKFSSMHFLSDPYPF